MIVIIATSIPIAFYLYENLFFYIKQEILYVVITLSISIITFSISICC